MASRAACDPQTGYIAGPNGPCRPSDLRCIEREWIERGQVVYHPSIGLCGRNHEDGGTVVDCPAGVGPDNGNGSGGRPGGGVGAPNGGSRRTTDGGGRPRSDNGRRNSPRRGVAPPPPPPPPTADEAAGTCPGLPEPRLHRNPDREGVTGMATWLWADAHPALRSTATIRGHAVTCTAVPEQWTWYTGDGASHSRSRPGGEPPDHAAEHVYERKGAYTQRLVVRWRLETNYGTSSASRETRRPYQVVEIRGALVE